MWSEPMRRGLLIILSSPSGAGKSTLARRLMTWDASLAFSVSSTTRKMRKGEEEGTDYFFTDEDKFKQSIWVCHGEKDDTIGYNVAKISYDKYKKKYK